MREGISLLTVSHLDDLKNGSTLKLHVYPKLCAVAAIGPVDFVAEIGDQLGWLASTLRSSPVPEGVLACSPKFIRSFHTTTAPGEKDVAITASCKLSFELAMPQDLGPQSPGFCWAKLFRNPLLVNDYPVRPRDEPDTGLEMSLDMMTKLVRSSQLTRIGGRIMLKGFCSLLVATAVSGDAVLWHYIYNSTGGRISYYDPRLESIQNDLPEGIELEDLEARRHIVGWCSDSREYTGMHHLRKPKASTNMSSVGHADANFDIKASNLRSPSTAVVIETVYVEAGGPMVVGAMAKLGQKDKPIYMPNSSGLSELLDWVSDLPVVFYDVNARRAWLVPGASALLHLVRASIKRDSTRDVYRPKWRLNKEFKGACPMEVLNDPENLNTPLYLDDRRRNSSGDIEDVFYTLRDRVMAVIKHLESVVDHQAQVAAQDGIWIRTSTGFLARKAAGFDFWDVAKPDKSIHGKVCQVNDHYGHGWVDYVRSVKAMVIFGSDFGELIRAGGKDVCPGWKSVPPGQNLMCASIRTLKVVRGAKSVAAALGRGELARGIIWSSHSRPFTPCQCLALQPPDSDPAHLDPVQILLPIKKLIDFGAADCEKVTLSGLGDGGAVIFGHMPYHKARPRPRLPRRSSHEREHSRGGSSSGETAGGKTR
ncbi:hypothetical protein IMZ48_22345, partial [Candidatus Bathyarchaeota archaeon]|nr:hypothetical protein [Candidatus Bathyarchaeota archaeon]